MTAVCMIYGATGYMGRLILDAALVQGLRPVIAGRDEVAVGALAAEYGLSSKVFALDDPPAIADALDGVDVVLNAAGPFAATAECLAQICIAEGVHYLDICCELNVLEKLAVLDGAAREAGVTLLPGAGFSPAVGEALAVHLKRRLPGAVKLEIAVSHLLPATAGQIRTCLDLARSPSRALRRGRVKPLPRRRIRRFDFGRGAVRCYRLGWGELAAIHRSTGVRNVDFFVQRRRDLVPLIHLPGWRAALFRLAPVRRRLHAWAAANGTSPPLELRRQARTHLAGYAYDSGGQRAAARIHLPDLYTVTAELAVAALLRLADEHETSGMMTLTQYLGAEFLAGIPDLHLDWEELEISAPGERPPRVKRHVPWLRRWVPSPGGRGRPLAGTPSSKTSSGSQVQTSDPAADRPISHLYTDEDRPPSGGGGADEAPAPDTESDRKGGTVGDPADETGEPARRTGTG